MDSAKIRATAIFATALLAAGGAVFGAPAKTNVECAKDNGGITLPAGFCAVVVADDVGSARHLAVNKNGDIYVALSQVNGDSRKGGIAALRDTNGDGRADVTEYFGDETGTGIAVRGDWLYFAPDDKVLRYRLKPGQLVPEGNPETIVKNLPEQDEHSAKSMAFDARGNMYVNIGAPSNSCQRSDRAPHSPGIKPCSLLERHGGIWRFKADKENQTQGDGKRYATGTRNVIALAWNTPADQLEGVQMGRDQLHDLWPEHFTTKQSAELPAEEFLEIGEGDNFGWPYCYYDQLQGKRVLAPEYGGDGKKTDNCGKYPRPIMAFPGHWAPIALLFYTGKQFPERYREGAFIAFHGSWNRAPEPQAGYKVVFVPFAHGKPTGQYETFADGFAGTQKPMSSGDAQYRPVGLAQGPDGSLYISDSQRGRIWRVIYVGKQ